MKILRLLSVHLLLILCFASYTAAQSYDYPAYPQLDVTYEHMEGELEISPQGDIRGDIAYDIRFNIEKSDSIRLHAVRMQVENVLIDERTMDFEIHNEHLIVYLDETFTRSQLANLRIVYSTTPRFGVLRTSSGTMISSQLPRSTRHWLPVADYPSTMLSYDLTIRHQAGKSFVMSGSLVSNSVESVDSEVTRFRSATRRPVTTLFFALSDFLTTNRVINSRNIRMHVEQPNSVDLSPDRLITLADETIQRMEDLTGTGYPYRSLQIVALHDLVWEHRIFGSGVVFIDVSKNVEQQIMFGVMGQWAGNLMREMQWEDSDALQLMHGYFGQQLGLKSTITDTLLPWNAMYKKISPDNIDRYSYLMAGNNPYSVNITSAKEELFDESQYPVTWQDFTRTIYRTTGRLLTERPVFSEPETEEETGFRYDVALDTNESSGEATVRFSANGPALDELVTVQVTQYTFNESYTSDLTFTGGRDEIVLSLRSGLENIEFRVQNRDDVTLDVQKPFLYWIYQLRNSDDADQRLKAAVGLRQYSDNPDLQLAILDIIGSENDASVKSEILETLRMVTEGASGTSQIFLERIGQDQPVNVRKTALRALSAYSDNDRVISTLQSVIQSADNDTLRTIAIESLASISDTERFGAIVESLVVRETVLLQVPHLLQALAAKGAKDKTIELADTFISAEFPYAVRGGAMRLLLELDETGSTWLSRLDTLLTDSDPRIRYLATRALPVLSEAERNQLIENRLIEEYDIRVANALRSYR